MVKNNIKKLNNESKKRMTWRDKPKIIKKIPTSKDKIIMYIDESGEGNKKTLRKHFDSKNNNAPYQQRNDLYILNGVVLSGYDSLLLKKKMDKYKKTLTSNGTFDYNKKGIRPIVLRNASIESKNPPFNNMTDKKLEDLNNLIKSTKYIQIASGLNYYCYTQNRTLEANESSSPLLMSLGLLLINYADYLNSINKKGIIIFEEETKVHDQMKLNYILKVLKRGNKTYNKNFFNNITAVYFRKKWTAESKETIVTTAGLELADLTISPLRRVLHTEYLTIEKKLYNYPNYMNKGFNIIK